MAWFEGFDRQTVTLRGLPVTFRRSADWSQDKPALVLLHGFPQTHVMWHRVAQQLKDRYRLVMPDLRGYGDSSHEAGDNAPAHYSKRAMAQEVIDLLDHLGIQDFYLCGHDRGGRVAHRLALDHPQRVKKLCVIDIAPTLDMYDATDFDFARAYYHWFHLIQPSPLPELMIGGNAKAYLHAKLGGWGSQGLGYIEPEALAEYERCFCDPTPNARGLPAAIHSACEDYRASAGIDLQHDRESRTRGDKIPCDTLVLWGERGVVNRLFKPLELWQAQCAGSVSGLAVAAGHFIPEELPELTARGLASFMA
ncbi:MAG: alpha/beta hydrolase [Limnohabitans sp.]|jgi:haloacetate dehalogenase|uniref:alpha/beta fold hydrolase n=1 Tax=Limnohabitans sp. TaxID=1907725 RepID=UPI0011D71BDA|nr:MAG: alpha/beta hydrolase [Limnohabitans sp.]